MKPRVIIIGSGVSGLALSIRLAVMGMNVEVFEVNKTPGGKISELTIDGFRFDKGPSLFTMPEWMDDLKQLAKYPHSLEYHTLKENTRYFWENGKSILLPGNIQDAIRKLSTHFGEDEKKIARYFKILNKKMNRAGKIFLNAPLPTFFDLFNKSILKGLIQLPFFRPWITAHQHHRHFFSHPQMVQIFDRYITYCGSSPYLTSHMLNLAAWPEWFKNVHFPKSGMYGIVTYLKNMADYVGVNFRFSDPVKKIIVENNQAIGIISESGTYYGDVIVSAIDYETTLRRLLSWNRALPEWKQRSTSAWVFYLGVKGIHQELGLHNILFSKDYRREFEEIFDEGIIPSDPTVYIHISSKVKPDDAPPGHENWFVMINASAKENNNIEESEVFSIVRKKIKNTLGIDLQTSTITRACWNPDKIFHDTGSYGGALYGKNAHGPLTGWARPSSRSAKIHRLFFCGGSVHPGGGIPLCLKSAEMVAGLIKKML